MKRLICLMIAVLMLLSLCACSSTKKPSDDTTDSSVQLANIPPKVAAPPDSSNENGDLHLVQLNQHSEYAKDTAEEEETTRVSETTYATIPETEDTPETKGAPDTPIDTTQAPPIASDTEGSEPNTITVPAETEPAPIIKPFINDKHCGMWERSPLLPESENVILNISPQSFSVTENGTTTEIDYSITYVGNNYAIETENKVYVILKTNLIGVYDVCSDESSDALTVATSSGTTISAKTIDLYFPKDSGRYTMPSHHIPSQFEASSFFDCTDFVYYHRSGLIQFYKDSQLYYITIDCFGMMYYCYMISPVVNNGETITEGSLFLDSFTGPYETNSQYVLTEYESIDY